MIEKLKRAYKAAIRSGKICFVGKKLSAGFDYNFGCYLRVLDEADWSSFEEKESQFRAQIASRRLNHGDFICKGDISLWMKVHKILHGIFYKSQNFQVSLVSINSKAKCFTLVVGITITPVAIVLGVMFFAMAQ